MGRVKRSNALSRIFMRYVLVMLGSLVGLVIVAYLLLYLLISVVYYFWWVNHWEGNRISE